MGVNEVNEQSPLPAGEGQGDGATNQALPDNNAETQQSQNNLSQNNLPTQNPNLDVNTLALLLGLLQKVNKEKGDKAKPEDFIKVLENILEQEDENEIQELQK